MSATTTGLSMSASSVAPLLSPLLAKWRTAALNRNPYSLLTPEQTDNYIRWITQMEATENFLDERMQQPLPSFNRMGFPVFTPVVKRPFKPYLDEFVAGLHAQVIGMRLFDPVDAFVILRVDPMRDLMLVLRFEFSDAFVLTPASATTGAMLVSGTFITSNNSNLHQHGAYITNVMFEGPVTLSGHKKLLPIQDVTFTGYFYGTRDAVLFDQAEAALPSSSTSTATK